MSSPPPPIDAVLEVLPDAVVVTDPACTIVLANARAASMLRRPADALPGLAVADVLPPDSDVEVTSTPLDAPGGPFAVMTLRPRLAGRAELLRQQEAITELGRRALAGDDVDAFLQEAADTLAEVLDAELVGVLELLPGGDEFSMRGRVGWPDEYVVPVAGTQVGYSLVTREPVVMPDIAGEDRFPASELRDVGVVSGLAVPMVVADRDLGAIGVFSRRPREYSPDDLHFAGAVAIVLAETMERRRAEGALQEASARLRAVVDASPAVIYLKDLDGRVILANREFETLFGTGAGGAVGRLNQSFLDSQTGAEIIANDTAVVAEGTPREFEERLRLADGSERVFISLKFPLRDADGTIRGIGGVSTDVTERTRAAEERAALKARLARAERLESVGQLAGGIAHDFNNLLAVIANYAGFLRRAVEPGTRAAEDVDQILVACRGATELTRRLLLFSRRRAGNPEVIDLAAVIAETEQLLRRSLGEQVDLGTRVEPGLWAVRADRAQLEQVLMNLAINARDAMPDGGALTIEAGNVVLGDDDVPGLAGEAVRLAVTDTGSGMSADVLDRAFEPFFTTKPASEGSGLGLATVYGIVRGAGGEVELRSSGETGTAVIVHLPASPDAVPAPAGEEDGALAPAHGETVLVVEDKDAVRLLTARILEDAGYTVSTARDGVEALAAHGADGVPGIDALITDVVMPGLSGQELADALRQRRPGLPVVFVSGYTEDYVVEGARSEGATAFVEKPFSAEELLGAVRTVLDAPDGPG
jgi:two-component system cell cycle sensor histidine kinase/response regulator CckA